MSTNDEINALKSALQRAEQTLHTEKLKQQILSKPRHRAFHPLVQREDFQVHMTTTTIDPKEILYLSASNDSRAITCGGLSFRSYNIDASLTKRNSSYAVQVEYRADDASWERLFHQSEADYAIETEEFKRCQQKLGVEASPLDCALFVVETLCGIDFLTDNIIESFEEE